MGWLIFHSSGNAHHAVVSAAQGSPDGIWLPLANDALSRKPVNVAAGRRFQSVTLQRSAWQRQLAQAPLENTKGVRPTVTLPLPDGSFARFAIEDSPNMEAALAARFPEIKSYRAVGLDDPALIARFTWSPRGLYALIATPDTAYSVEPVGSANDGQYISYESKDAVAAGKYDCLTEEVPGLPQRENTAARDLSVINLGATRRNYRLALATTYEYMLAFGGGNKPGAIASVNTWLNAVNLIYERDLSAHFNLVANNDQLIYDTTSDPFTNGSAGTMLEEARLHFNNVIGAANYDVGHVLGTGASGVAYIGVACVIDEYKGGGVSLIPTSVGVGHPFYIGRIAHELGHQFNTHHTFNDNTGNCAGQRNATTAYESGSGFTIMAYSGSCNAIAFGRALHFHSGAVNAIAEFMQNEATCSTATPSGNTPPTVNAGVDRRIPKLTPFALTAAANDSDNGDYANLTYSWEQYDAGGTSFGNPAFTDEGDPASTTRPIFRPFSPTLSPQHLFPELFLIQDYNNEPPLQDADGLYVAQHLPRVSRNLNFKVIVRDQRGGVADDDVLLSVDGASGPFQVTAPDTRVRWVGGTQQTVTWSVNNTNNAPVSCANVKISLSIDNGETFPVTILGATPNDGSETITVPAGLSSGETRIKVEAVGNIFFDMSDASFLLESGSASCPAGVNLAPTSAVAGATVNLTGSNFTGVNSVLFSNNVSASFTVVSDTQINVTVPAGVVAGPLMLIKSGCNNTQTPSFTPVACSYSLSATSASVGAGIQTASVNVTANPGCAWTATSNASWITISSGASGNGNGTVSLSVAANTGAARTSTVTVAGQTFTVTQSGGCTITLSATNANVAATSGTGSFNVTAGNGCTWTATSNQSWLTITNGASGNGNGTVSYSFAANTGASRSAVISVGGQSFTLTQAGGCTITLNASSANVAATNGTGSFNVTAGSGCTWTATSNQTWLTVTNGASGSGNATVSYSFAANTGASRSAVISVGGQSYTVTQVGGCTITLSANSANVAATSSTGSFNVTAGSGCTWTATSNQSWLTITNGASGSGNGAVNYSATSNTGVSRSAVISVGGQTFTVTQAAGCAITLNTSSVSFAAAANTGSFNVTAGTGCTWSAVSNQTWLTITSGASGSGNGAVNFSVAANTGAARTATITVSGQSFTVIQAGGCNVTLGVTSASVAAAASTGSFAVTAGNGCGWTAVSNASWLTFTNATGTGNGTVNYSVAANTGVARSAAISVGGKSFTVSQAGDCSVTINVTSASTVATSGTGSISVTAGTGCTWTAVSNAAWLTITSGASGSGSGTMVFAVAANAGVARSATITVNGLTFTLTQASGCAYNATISGQTFSSQASLGTVAVTTTAGCGWTASVNQAAGQSWLAITTAASGVGNGTVGFALSPNTTGNQRQATLTVAGRTFIVSQDANCGVTLPTSVVSVAAVAGSGSASATTNPLGCVFNATSNVDWLVITGKTSSAVNFNIAANSGGARTGSIMIGDKLYTVNQAAAPVSCTAYFTPVAHSASYAGGVYNVTVSTGHDCRWAATTSATWIMLDAATASGVRRGAVSYSLATNTTTQARTGTIQVLGQAFSITQAAAPTCSFSVSPGTLTVPAGGGSTNVSVMATNSCSWSSAASDVAAQITAGIYGTGNGTVALMTQPNAASAARNFKVVIAGQTVNVTQAGSATANPLPTAVRTYPDALALGAARTLTVYGRNFLSNSVVRWNGAERATTFVSDMELRVTIPATDLVVANLGTAKVTVFNPASTANLGGGSSNALDCRVVRVTVSVSAAHYGNNGDQSATRDGIVAAFGSDLASGTLVANSLPLPTTLGGTTVTIYDSAGASFLAPLFFVAKTQVNYLLPTELAPGLAEVIISDNAGRWESGALMISGVNPGLFTSNASGQGVVAGSALRVRNGVNTYENIARFDSTTSKMVATPIDLGPTTDQVYLVLYGTGFRHRSDLRNVQCFIGGTTAGVGTEVSVLYLDKQGSLAGLDQTNLLLPRTLAGSGLVKLWLKVDGKWANPVEVNIK